MEDFARKALLLSLMQDMKEQGSWCGETHVQKSVYFLQEGLKVPLDFKYLLYKHGPFSFELREVLGEMRGSFLLRVEPRGSYGSSLEVDEPGTRLKENFPRTVSRYQKHIQFIAQKIASRDVVGLERMGTALYVRTTWSALSPGDQAAKITELKPHITIDLAEQAMSEIEGLLNEASYLEW